MSKVFNMVGFKEKPKIHVIAKAGALLNLYYKGSSIILQSYQLGSSENNHIFTVNMSDTAYIVEDVTNGKSVEVLVDAVAVFEINLYWTSLIPKTPIITGTGLGFKPAYDRTVGASGRNGIDPHYEEDIISWTFESAASYYTNGIVYTVPVDMTNINTIKARICLVASSYCSLVVVSGYYEYLDQFFVISSGQYIVTDYKTLSAGDHDIELDVSGVSGNAYVGFITRANGSKNSISALNLFI